MREHDRRARSKATEVKREGFVPFPRAPSSPFPLKCRPRRLWLSLRTQTRTQSLLGIHCGWWEGFSEFAVHQGKEGRKTRSDVTFPPSSQAPLRVSNCLSIFLCENLARINQWRLGTSLLRTSFPLREQGKRAERDHARSSGEASPRSGRTCLQTSYDSI